jgi:hypothetical protein
MANIALNKPSGGQLILSPEDGTSTETVTIPSVGVMAANAPTGKVLQVVEATTNTTVTIDSTGTWVDTTLSASITPSSANSKIIVQSLNRYWNDRWGGEFRILRNGTQIVAEGISYANYIDTGAGANVRAGNPLSIIDTPSTTSQVTYTVQAKKYYSGGFVIQEGGMRSNIILMEVAA